MIKTITIGDQSVELNSSAGWLYVYKERFGHDILPDLMPVIESVLEMSVRILGNIEGDEIDIANVIGSLDSDILSDIIINLAGAEVTTLLNIFWALAKKADKTIEGPEDFFDRFEVFPFDEIVPDVFRMIVESSISSKNAKSLLGSLEALKLSRSTNLQSQAPTEG